jgi:hypothetical protein
MSSKKKGCEFKIVGESTEEVVNLDVEMDNSLVGLLIDYTNANITKKESDQLLLNWAVTDILKKQTKKEKRNGRKRRV